MSALSGVEIGLAGFRFIRANPRVVAIWAGIYLAVSVVLGAAMVLTIGPAMTEMAQAQASGDPAASLALMGRLAPGYVVVGILTLVFYAVLYAAMARAILQPANNGAAYLALGRDELRQGLLILLAAIVGFAAIFALFLVAGIIAAASGWILGRGLPSVLLSGVAFLAAACALTFFMIRLSLASPLTFDRRRVNLFGSWKLTRGLFWPLLGGYLIAFLLVTAASLLYFVIALALMGASGGGFQEMVARLQPDMSSLQAYFTPIHLLLLALSSGLSAIMWPVLLMPPVSAYAQLNPRMDEVWD